MTLGLIWAQARNGVIGADGGMPWRLPEDARHFREVTSGATVVMGRKTWESLPPRFQPLPDRRNLVVTRQGDWRADGAEAVSSIAAAVRAAGGQPTWVIGGGELYAAMIAHADVLEVTDIDLDVPGDTRAPSIDHRIWHPSPDDADWSVAESGVRYRFTRYIR
jgi:Dihydrofolate reductase